MIGRECLAEYVIQLLALDHCLSLLDYQQENSHFIKVHVALHYCAKITLFLLHIYNFKLLQI